MVTVYSPRAMARPTRAHRLSAMGRALSIRKATGFGIVGSDGVVRGASMPFFGQGFGMAFAPVSSRIPGLFHFQH